MKLAVYCLVAVAVAVLGIGTAFLCVSPGDARRDVPAARTVYVDAGKLVELHPNWGALIAMRSTINQVRRVSRAGYCVVRRPDLGSVKPGRKVIDGVSRSKIEAFTARRADAALRQFEMEQHRSLQARLDASRAEMMASAQTDLRLRERDIQDEAAKRTCSVVEKRRADLLRAEIRAAALQVAQSSPGLDTKAIKRKRDEAEAELSRIRAVCELETDQANAEAQAKISRMRESASEEIAAAVDAYGGEKVKDIEKRVSSARDRIVRDMKSGAGFGYSPVTGKAGRSLPCPLFPVPYSLFPTFGSWQASLAELEARIRDDVRRAVSKLAVEQGVKVVFTRGDAGLPDETRVFAGLMRQRGWRACEPALYWAKGD